MKMRHNQKGYMVEKIQEMIINKMNKTNKKHQQ